MRKALEWFRPVAAPTLFLVSFLAIMGCLFGCRHLDPAGVYQGNQLLYQSEIAIPTSHAILQTYVQWELEYRTTLAKWPEIRKSADTIRRNGRQWETTANNLHDAYATDPSATNRDALSTALGVLRSAITEANGYMLRAATQPK